MLLSQFEKGIDSLASSLFKLLQQKKTLAFGKWSLADVMEETLNQFFDQDICFLSVILSYDQYLNQSQHSYAVKTKIMCCDWLKMSQILEFLS